MMILGWTTVIEREAVKELTEFLKRLQKTRRVELSYRHKGNLLVSDVTLTRRKE